MNIAILGYGSQGRAAYEYWNKPENIITICDQNTGVVLPDGAGRQLGDNYLAELDRFDLIVRSPSVHPRDIISANSPEILTKTTTVTNEFLRVCPSRNLIGVTGTKGKGTTSTLIARMLEAAGHRVHLGGNIGTPPLDMLQQDIKAGDWVVLELANFQLIDLSSSPHIAVCLMMAPEHLNWHADFEEYVTAKQQLFAHQTAEDIAVYFADNEDSKRIAGAGQGRKLPYFAPPGAVIEAGEVRIGGQTICRTNDLKLLGKHNWQNACAAVTAVWQITQDTSALRSVLTTFTGLEHRLELVDEIDGVQYYDDSFGTTPETAIVAIEALNQPKVIILGGSDKGASYDALAQTVATSNVRAAVLIGDTAPKIREALTAAGVTALLGGGTTMADIVAVAKGQAQPGDVVLLSTGCASFGLFQNYKDRGDQFKQAVKERSI